MTTTDPAHATDTTSSESGATSETGTTNLCGNGVLDDLEQCDDGKETKLCNDDCSVAACGDGKSNDAAGEPCDDGNVDDTDACLSTCKPATCGDGFLQADVEACDDGNVDDTDACTSACEPAVCGDGVVQAGVEQCDDANNVAGDGCEECKLPWRHEGIALEVPVAELIGWVPCWSSTYEAGALVSGLEANCNGDHVMLGCRPLGSDTITMAAHAPREDVFHVVKYDDGERHQANGISWGYSPYWGVVGFAPSENAVDCLVAGQDAQMCWRVGGNLPAKFTAGYRCGQLYNMSIAETKAWERVAFHAWD